MEKTRKEIEQEVCKLYQEGVSPKKISEILNITSINRILRKHNIERNRLKTPSEDEVNIIITEYLKGISSEIIARNINVDGSTVRRVLRNNNILMRPATENKRKYNIDVDYFENIDTEEKAYFLGILYADGSLGIGGSGIKITLQEEDVDILEKLSNIIYGFRKLKISENHEKNHKFFTLNFYSEKMHKDLCKLGCSPRKSFTITFPDKIIKQDLIRHFIRGYLDGDGCICVTNENRPRVVFTYIG